MRLKGKQASSLKLSNSYARQVGSEHFSSSAKSGQGVIEIFSTLAKSKSFLANQSRGNGELKESERRSSEEEGEYKRSIEC
jgi:hypothetical protein